MRSRVLRLGAAVVLCALAGCRTAPVFYPAAPPWEVRRPQLQARQHFDLSGRVAVATAHDGFNANLHWEQQGHALAADARRPARNRRRADQRIGR